MRKRSALGFTLTGFAAGAVLFTAASIVLAWTGPTSAPPNGNVSAPINVGTIDQIKSGAFGVKSISPLVFDFEVNGSALVSSLAVTGNALLSGASRYLSFGSTAGSTGYGFRDNAGTMEFKDSGGNWQSMLSASSAFSQINFADGTTQTTAAGGATNGTVGGGCTGVGGPQDRLFEGGPVPESGWGNATQCSTSTTCDPGTMSGTCPVGYTATRIGGGSLACIGGSSDCGCGGTFQWPGTANYKPSYYPAPMMCIKD
ncbi:hypothetical protein A2765_04520 [Candidatus Kaiserbacteria bacterium RIFCSPHIGHO2_01_FULL_56_24]|uniref:Uncharacterized protein n=1 Tax=Candidatus Kaiserbacteria bacterium RIFCSPHIGHO2_01_FULL_56_24 TaxID=1798487 RepID=A0A1F6DEG1_9BACT|nr:MAG: hypothetical protein A2765_04520 [Candidatus Kaiserbacteria bacterium RIFCSPHIGHO2_01_FULL_56_24]